MFVLGQTVRWTSQASGKTAEKTGTIVAIIPAGAYPHPIATETFGKNYNYGPLRGFGQPRETDSYLVAVAPTSDRGRAKLYWPRTSALTLVQDREAA